ncbi:hypothetical protein BDR22DRAFT_816401 [Usnea florida]
MTKTNQGPTGFAGFASTLTAAQSHHHSSDRQDQIGLEWLTTPQGTSNTTLHHPIRSIIIRSPWPGSAQPFLFGFSLFPYRARNQKRIPNLDSKPQSGRRTQVITAAYADDLPISPKVCQHHVPSVPVEEAIWL